MMLTETSRRKKRTVMRNKRELRRRPRRIPSQSPSPSLRERTKKKPSSLRRSLNVNNNDCYKVNYLNITI